MPTIAPEISVVIPVFNEEQTLPELDARLREALCGTDKRYEIVFVNDGSSDRSAEIMHRLREADERVRIIEFSRNFGHQPAISAGLDHAAGDAVIVMDGDLQDPPEVLPTLIERWEKGYDVVYAVRRNRKEGVLDRFAYTTFYRLIARLSDTSLPLDSGDFALMDRKVVDLIVQMPERSRYIRGLRSWLGFNQIGVEYDRSARYAGRSKYDLRSLLALASDGIVSFSDIPLKLAMRLGLAITGLASVIAMWTLVKRLVGYDVVPGFATLALLVLFFGGVQLVTIGILGEYIARIYTEVKGRPQYVVRRTWGSGAPEQGRDVSAVGDAAEPSAGPDADGD
jgi:glycosyltransferase involved in cell wall biosynthesis